mmetsp:Transcript_33429/g.67471  ORF Transcript_33429/g.67471 Transcript_33429/m.67471 type:complete len:286 (-) Transcript_33429:1527-2384(-)
MVSTHSGIIRYAPAHNVILSIVRNTSGGNERALRPTAVKVGTGIDLSPTVLSQPIETTSRGIDLEANEGAIGSQGNIHFPQERHTGCAYRQNPCCLVIAGIPATVASRIGICIDDSNDRIRSSIRPPNRFDYRSKGQICDFRTSLSSGSSLPATAGTIRRGGIIIRVVKPDGTIGTTHGQYGRSYRNGRTRGDVTSQIIRRYQRRQGTVRINHRRQGNVRRTSSQTRRGIASRSAHVKQNGPCIELHNYRGGHHPTSTQSGVNSRSYLIPTRLQPRVVRVPSSRR